MTAGDLIRVEGESSPFIILEMRDDRALIQIHPERTCMSIIPTECCALHYLSAWE